MRQLVGDLSAAQVRKIEKRMRRGNLSKTGFLGRFQGLSAVIARDEKTLERLGVTTDQIADRLESVVGQAYRIEDLAMRGHDVIEKGAIRGLRNGTGGGIPVEGHFLVTGMRFHGIQECPFESPGENTCGVAEYAYADFSVTNTTNQSRLAFPGLAIHLCRDHHFFEGSVRYRVDPTLAVRTLQIEPGRDCAPMRGKETTWRWCGGDQQKYCLRADQKALMHEPEVSLPLTEHTRLCLRGDVCMAVVQEDECAVTVDLKVGAGVWTSPHLRRGYWEYRLREESYVMPQ